MSMFFLFASPRSGTTLMAQCLSSHPDLHVPYETDFIVPMAFIFDRIKNPELGRSMVANLITQSAGFEKSLGEYLKPQKVREIVFSGAYRPDEIVDNLYAAAAAAAGKK